MPARMPFSLDFQAFIFCGPGVSLNTFTSTPEEFPKALIPIANRPMVWYPLNWCYRMNILRITLITPPSSRKAIENALSRNPDLTSLPLPRPDVIAPEVLSQNTGTAEILRLPEVQAAIDGHFLVLPCDILCELSGESLLETWMVHVAGMVGSPVMPGGLGVWYPTKGEETNFLMTAQLPPATVSPPKDSLRPSLSQVVYSSTTDTLGDIIESKKVFPIRHSLIRKHGRIRILTTNRDAHIYFLPYWILDFLNRNLSFESLSEDLIGWWAKATWQPGLIPKLSLNTILSPSSISKDNNIEITLLEEDSDLNLQNMSTTQTSQFPPTPPTTPPSPSAQHHKQQQPQTTTTSIPPFLTYTHPSSSPLQIHRIDTPALLLTHSLLIASLPPTSPSPFTQPQKHHLTATIALRTTITQDTLVGANTTINQHSAIKNCVIGSNCVIKEGAKLTRCLLMDEVEVGEKCVLTGVIVGSRARVGGGCKLGEGCEVQPGFVVDEGTEGKGEKFMVFEGLDGDGDGGEEGEDKEDGEIEQGG